MLTLVNTLCAQELQSYLQDHRPWLQNLLSDSLGDGLEGSAAQTQEAALLSSLIAALLKCCDPEVALSQPCPPLNGAAGIV